MSVEPTALRPAERAGDPGRPIYASYAEAAANEGTLAITPSSPAYS